MKTMKKTLCVFLCLLCALLAAACGKKDAEATRIWMLSPDNAGSEQEIRAMIASFDSDAVVSFVPKDEANERVAAALARGDAPDVIMSYTDSLPDWVEKKQLTDLSTRLQVSKIESDKLSEAARRACLYQGKPWGVPLFTDVYMLASNRALVANAPQTVEQLKATCATLAEKQVPAFSALTPLQKSLLFEATLQSRDGTVFNARKTKLTIASQNGIDALGDCLTVLKDAAEEKDAVGSGKAAFSVMTTFERRQMAKQYPDAEIALAPLFGLDRLQTVALCMNFASKNQTKAFALLEYLQGGSDKLAVLYDTYTAHKKMTPKTDDEEAVVQLLEARPAPDLCGYESLVTAYMPAALDKAQKGLDAAVALQEATTGASDVLWPGKRE